MYVLVAGLLMFHLMHTLRAIAPGWRQAQIDRLGEGPWKGLFSLASFIALGLIILGYSSADNASDLYEPMSWGRGAAMMLTLIAFVLMTFNMRSSRLSAITRHPFLLSVILWSLAHLLVRGDIASVVLFGSFLVWSIWKYWFDNKSNEPLPPIAPLVQDIGAALTGVLIWVAFVFLLHGWFFGHPLTG